MDDQFKSSQSSESEAAAAPAALPGEVTQTYAIPYEAAQAVQPDPVVPPTPDGASQPAQPTIQQPVPPMQNIYITQQVTQQVQQSAPVMMVAPKSVLVSVILTFLFGPLGMFYSTVSGALIMIVVSVVVAAFTLGFGLLFTWPACVVWGAIAASNYNKSIVASSMTQITR